MRSRLTSLARSFSGNPWRRRHARSLKKIAYRGFWSGSRALFDRPRPAG